MQARFRKSTDAGGLRQTAQITATYNSLTQFTRRRAKLLNSEDDLGGEFRLHGISLPYFGKDKRSFMGGKAFICALDQCTVLDKCLQGRSKFDMVVTVGKTSTACQPQGHRRPNLP